MTNVEFMLTELNKRVCTYREIFLEENEANLYFCMERYNFGLVEFQKIQNELVILLSIFLATILM